MFGIEGNVFGCVVDQFPELSKKPKILYTTRDENFFASYFIFFKLTILLNFLEH